MTAEDENPAPPAPLPPEPATLPSEAGAPTEAPITTIEPIVTDTVVPHEEDPDFAEVEPAAPLTADERLKAHMRDVLAAQPFRGDAVHKDDLLAVIDALIDGPPDA